MTLGRQLIEAKRGIKHGGWQSYVEKLGIAGSTARAWMQEAGYVESPARGDAGDLPEPSTRVAAGIDRRPRKRDEEPDPPAPIVDGSCRFATTRTTLRSQPDSSRRR